MIEVAGKPLIAHALDQTEGLSLALKLANLHYKPAVLRCWLNVRGVRTITELPDILDTGGGLAAARALLGDGPVFTINSDAVFAGPPALADLAQHWDASRMDALLLTVPVSRAIGREQGDFTQAPDGRLQRQGPAVYTGAQIVNLKRLEEIAARVFSLNALWDVLLDEGRLFGATYPGTWCDVGHPNGIKAAEAMLETTDV